MAVGGKRPGAGRPKGATNKRTVETAKAIEESGLTPLDFLTSVYRDIGEEMSRRVDAAKAAAPYVHARLNAIELAGKDGHKFAVAVFKGLNDAD